VLIHLIYTVHLHDDWQTFTSHFVTSFSDRTSVVYSITSLTKIILGSSSVTRTKYKRNNVITTLVILLIIRSTSVIQNDREFTFISSRSVTNIKTSFNIRHRSRSYKSPCTGPPKSRNPRNPFNMRNPDV